MIDVRSTAFADVKFKFPSVLILGFLMISTSYAEESSKISADSSIVLGSDKRHPYNNNAIGRIASSNNPYCTGWLTNFGAVITAGHCYKSGANLFFEVNVPLSKPNGVTVNPPPESRFPLTFYKHVAPPVHPDTTWRGDWAIASIAPSSGKSAFEKQRNVFRLVSLGDIGVNKNDVFKRIMVRVSGYGVDGPPPDYGANGSPRNEFNKTLQTDFGQLLGNENGREYRVCYLLDTMGGSSGGPVVLNGGASNTGGGYFGGVAIGIHNAGSSNKSSCSQPANIGQTFDDPDFAKNLHMFGGRDYSIIKDANIVYVDEQTLVFEGDGKVMKPFSDITKALSIASKNKEDSVVIAGAGSYFVSDQFILTPSATIHLTTPGGDVTWRLSK